MTARALALFLFAVSLPDASASDGVVRLGGPAMGTVLEVTVVAGDGERARELAEAALAEARRWDDVLTTWRPEGELARMNAHAGSGWFAASPDLLAALRSMTELSRVTGGAFDPAVGPLVELWREGAPADELVRAGGPFRIAAALTLGPEGARLERRARIDAGGIGKGIALDAIARRLRTGGARAAYLDFGGSSQLAFGKPPGPEGAWRLAVAGAAPGEILGTLRLSARALSTSRASGAGASEGAVVDPRSQRPVEPPRVATVLAADATSAEAWSTALVVLGPPGLETARRHGVEAIVDDASGLHRTSGFPLEP